MTGQSELTKNQRAVMTSLRAANRPMTAYEILDDVNDAGIRAPAQVYRALDKLLSLGHVHRVESLNAFVVCTHDHNDAEREEAVAFAICEDCGDVTELSRDAADQSLRFLQEAAGFDVNQAIIELRGRCTPCRDLKSSR